MLKKFKNTFERLFFFYKYPKLKNHNLFLHPKGEFISDSIRNLNSYYEFGKFDIFYLKLFILNLLFKNFCLKFYFFL